MNWAQRVDSNIIFFLYIVVLFGYILVWLSEIIARSLFVMLEVMIS